MALLDIFKSKKERQIETPDSSLNIMPVLPQEIYESGVLQLQDVIAPSALQIDSNYVRLGNKFARVIFVMSYPRFLGSNWFSPIINLDKIFDIAIFVHPVETSTVLRQLQRKVAEVQSQIHGREDKGLVRDPMLDTAYQDLEMLRDKLQQAQEKLFAVGLYITVYGDTLDELDKVEMEVKSILESKLIYLRPALFRQADGLETVFPVGTDKLEIHSQLNSSPLSSMFPFVSFDLSSDSGILYGINRHNNSLVLFDRFSLENYNSVIFAVAGAGKSYTTKLEVLRTLMFGADVIIIDPEKEYEYLAEAVGGRYFNISLNSIHHINPFDLPPIRDDESPADVLRSNVINLVGLFRLMLSGLTPEEDSIMDKAITETYASRDITPESDFNGVIPPTISDLELVLVGMEGGESLAQRLSKYVSGSWSGFLNQPSNVDISKSFVVFSIRDMEDELRSIAMHIITHYIWNVVRKDLKKRLLVVDEAWWMMKSEDTASFLFSVAKRCRKYYLGLATITQNVEDFLNSPYGVPLITNSAMQLLLKQSPASIGIVQRTFNLTEEEKFLLLESEVGEGIFFAGMKHVAIKILASYTEDQIITSDPAQLLAIKKSKEELEGNVSEEKKAWGKKDDNRINLTI